jgi:gluconate 2-dehydrogenase gamma chain
MSQDATNTERSGAPGRSLHDSRLTTHDPATLSRREILAALAATAGAFAIPRPAEAAQVMITVQRARPVATGVASAYAPKVYTAHEFATVQLLTDYVIPKDARSGSATDAAVPEFMDTILDLEPTMRTAHRGGLAWLDHQSHLRFDKDFVDATDTQRRAILDDIANPRTAKPEFALGVSWFNSFRDFTASGFFTSEIGVGDLGYLGNTVVPEWTGCPDANYTRLGVKKA